MLDARCSIAAVPSANSIYVHLSLQQHHMFHKSHISHIIQCLAKPSPMDSPRPDGAVRNAGPRGIFPGAAHADIACAWLSVLPAEPSPGAGSRVRCPRRTAHRGRERNQCHAFPNACRGAVRVCRVQQPAACVLEPDSFPEEAAPHPPDYCLEQSSLPSHLKIDHNQYLWGQQKMRPGDVPGSAVG